jgi:hypothetical protein
MYRDVAQLLPFLREGRGVSFHEFDIAIGRVEVKTSMFEYHRLAGFLRLSARDRAFRRLLRCISPEVNPAWHWDSIDLAIAKIQA